MYRLLATLGRRWYGSRSHPADLMRGVQSSAKLTRFFSFVKQEFLRNRQMLCLCFFLLQYPDLIYDHKATTRQDDDNRSCPRGGAGGTRQASVCCPFARFTTSAIAGIPRNAKRIVQCRRRKSWLLTRKRCWGSVFATLRRQDKKRAPCGGSNLHLRSGDQRRVSGPFRIGELVRRFETRPVCLRSP